MQNIQQSNNATSGVFNIQFAHAGMATTNAPRKENNWAFMDMQNLYKGICERNWEMDWKSLRQYLKDKLQVTNAVAFMGRIKKYQPVYDKLEQAGFNIHFREVKMIGNKVFGGNVDVDLATYAIDLKTQYDKAVIIADDGDYWLPVSILKNQGKLKLVISTHLLRNSSDIIKEIVGSNMIQSIHGLRNIVEARVPKH